MRNAHPLETVVACPYCHEGHWVSPTRGERSIVAACSKTAEALKEGATCCHRYFVVEFTVEATARAIEGEAQRQTITL